MPDEATTGDILKQLAEQPIGGKHLQGPKARGDELLFDAEAKEAFQRASKKWLPSGKRSTSGPEARERKQAFYEKQIDIEDAVEAAGGQRGALKT